MAEPETRVLRCTASDEEVFLPPERCALLVEDAGEPQAGGFGAYLLSGGSGVLPDGTRFALPKERALQPGDLLLFREAGGQQYVSSLRTADRGERTLFLTGRCNSNCVMCPYGTKQRMNGRDESTELLLQCIQAMDPRADYLCLTGGEPTLLKEDFLRILAAIKVHFTDCELHILTNGRAFCYADFLRDYRRARPYRTLLGIPLHAADATLHDRISASPGSFEQTALGLDRLLSLGEHVELRIVASALNARYMPELAEFIGRRYPNVNHVSIMGLEMMGNAMLRRREVWLPFAALWPQVSRSVDILIRSGVSVQLFNFPLCTVEERYHALYRRSISLEKVRYLPACERCGRKNQCGGFFQTTIVMPDLAVQPYE